LTVSTAADDDDNNNNNSSNNNNNNTQPSNLRKASFHGHRYTKAEKIQALTLWSLGHGQHDIERLLGIKRRSFFHILQTAKKRGYDPKIDFRVLEDYVIDGVRTGRPKKKPVAPVEASAA
jgi:hypothetical protein